MSDHQPPLTGESPITVSISHLGGLFHSFDPAPFRERELDAEAEKFIMPLARDYSHTQALSVVVQLPREQSAKDIVQTLRAAINNHFDYRADQSTRELRELFREGWRSLLVGIPILAASLVAGHMLNEATGPTSTRWLISESLLILGWVANWRPLEIFLYGWGPILRRRTLQRRLAVASVDIRPV